MWLDDIQVIKVFIYPIEVEKLSPPFLRAAHNNRLLTEREGQYSPVRPEQARLVSCLLYGTLFLIVKCTSGAMNLFSFLSFSFLSF